MTDDTELTVDVCPPDKPFRVLPVLSNGPQMLGWHVGKEYSGDRLEPRTVLLSDMCKGDPAIGEVVKIISHEFLHDVLEQEVSAKASVYLDNIVEDGNFLVDREENYLVDEREPIDKWRHTENSEHIKQGGES